MLINIYFGVFFMAIRADNIGSKISIDDIRDFIPDDHPCFLVEKIVERVDFF